jgi:hypothetical protein
MLLLVLIAAAVWAMDTRPRYMRGAADWDAGSAGAPVTQPPITYHGGLTLTGPTMTVHTIYYGNKFAASTSTVLNAYYAGLGASHWWSITNDYFAHPVGVVGGSSLMLPTYPSGTTINGRLLTSIVSSAITGSHIGFGNNTEIYVFLMDKSVRYSGMCTQWCGFHSYYIPAGHGAQPVYVVIVGSAAACPSACSVLSSNGNNSPNANFEADSFVNIISHELSETVTDPQGTAWYDSAGEENSDKCAWTFGTVTTAAGRVSNEAVGARRFLIQQEWNRTRQACEQ